MATKVIKEKRNKVTKVHYEDANLTKRFLAYLIDWYLGALATAFPIAIIAQKLYGSMLNQNLLDFEAPYGLIGGVLGFICACFYFIIVPVFINKDGQTLGKKICKIKIVSNDDEKVDFTHMILRQLVGVMVIEGVLVTASSIWHQVVTLLTHVDIVQPLMYVGFAVTLVSVLLVAFSSKHRAIHDYIGNTRVVNCQ